MKIKKFNEKFEDASREYDIQYAAKDAQETFWSVVVNHFPEIETVDFPPEATIKFDAACEEAIRTWVEINTPE